ncbi:MAG: nitroreductase family protein [Spirochaetaceae bacterium]|nr:nitroreductase family protein [Spirochaetaceae bacterium]
MSILLTRRSVRKFTTEAVSDDNIRHILRAAMYAPSAVNKQNWQFYVVKRGEKLAELATIWDSKILDKTTMEKEFYTSRSAILRSAAAAILICGVSETELGEGESWPVNCGAATQNLLLAAHELGLGGVWLGVFNLAPRIKEVIEFFNLPANHRPFALCAIGHPAAVPAESKERYDESKVHWIK